MTVNAVNARVSLPASTTRSSPCLHPSPLPPGPGLPSLPPPDDSISAPGEGGKEEWTRPKCVGRGRRTGIARVAGLQHPSEESGRRASPCHFLAIRRNVETVPFNDLRVTKCCHCDPPKDAAGPDDSGQGRRAPVKGARAAGQVQIPDGRRARRRGRCAARAWSHGRVLSHWPRSARRGRQPRLAQFPGRRLGREREDGARATKG